MMLSEGSNEGPCGRALSLPRGLRTGHVCEGCPGTWEISLSPSERQPA